MHQFGVTQVLEPLSRMDYNTLMELFRELKTDGSKKGVTLRNLFSEYLGSVGTRAAAMAVKDGVDVNMFGDDRTAAKALTSVAYHIRRPNEALVQQFQSLQVFC